MLSGLVDQAGGDLLHAEYGLIELGHAIVSFGVGGDMPDSREHNRTPSVLGALVFFLG
jgi:hypothetical protein